MNKDQELQLMKPERGGELTIPNRFDVESIFRLAIEKGGDVGTLERLMAIRKEINAESAKAAYDSAMASFQSECPVIGKTKGVNTDAGTLAYKYAPFESIIAQVKPVLQKHGFSYTLDTDVESAVGWVIAKCIVTHAAGHSQTSTAKFPLGNKTRVMSDTQVYGAALTFASRRVFCNAFGIVTAGEDTDGGTKPKPAGPSTMRADCNALKPLAQELWNVLAPVRGKKQDWVEANQWLWREEILDGGSEEAAPHLSAEKFREVITKAKERLA